MNKLLRSTLLYFTAGGLLALAAEPLWNKFHSIDSVRARAIDQVNQAIAGKLPNDKHYICRLNTVGGEGLLECSGFRSPDEYVVEIKNLGDSKTNIAIKDMIALYGEILKHTGCMMATIDDVHYNQDCEKGPSI